MAVLRSPTTRAFLGGLLAANSLAHLATALTGREHLTPLAGRTSGPLVNGVWGGVNLLGGLLLARSAGGPDRRWDPPARGVRRRGGCVRGVDGRLGGSRPGELGTTFPLTSSVALSSPHAATEPGLGHSAPVRRTLAPL